MRMNVLLFILGVVIGFGGYLEPNSWVIKFIFNEYMPGLLVLLGLILELFVTFVFYWVPSRRFDAAGDARNFIPLIQSTLMDSILVLAGIGTIYLVFFSATGSVAAMSVVGICSFSIIMFAFIWIILNELLRDVNGVSIN